MESLSSYAKRFVAHITKPDVDFVFGLSPVISIEQKACANNPRSTVGSTTEISSHPEPALSPAARHIVRAAVRRRRAGPGQPDPRGDPLPARGHRGRAAGARLQGLRRGPRLRLHRGSQERLPPPDRHARPVHLLDKDEPPRIGRPAHGRRRRPRCRRPQARESDQGCYRRDAARGRRAPAGAGWREGEQSSEQGRGGPVLQGAVQPDASLRVRRHRSCVLRLQQSRERMPHVRRARRGQADASGAADSRSSGASSGVVSCARPSSTTSTRGTDA